MPAVPFIPLIAAGVSSAASIYTQHKGADTAKEIANTQAGAAGAATSAMTGQLDRALSLQQAMYAQNNASLLPWVAQGTAAVNTMGNLMGLGGMAGATAAPTVPTTMAPTTPTTTVPTLASMFGSNVNNPRPTTPGNQDTGRPDQEAWRNDRIAERRAAKVLPTGETVDPASAVAQSQSSYTQMQAPDGSVETVPAALVDHYTRLGALALS